MRAPHQDPDQSFDAHGLADILGISVSKARQMLRSGEIGSYRLGTGPKAPFRTRRRDIHEYQARTYQRAI